MFKFSIQTYYFRLMDLIVTFKIPLKRLKVKGYTFTGLLCEILLGQERKL